MAISYSMAPTLRDYDMTTPEGRRRWVFDHWVQIAPYGYSAYLRHGRGAVLVNGRLKEPDAQPPRWLTPEVAQTMSSELVDAINDYDPANETVVVFDLRGTAFVFGRYQVDDYSPPLVYAEQWTDAILLQAGVSW